MPEAEASAMAERAAGEHPSGEHPAKGVFSGKDARDLELERLRALLLQPEIDRLEALVRRLDNPVEHARDVSAILAEALLLASARDEKLNKALEPAFEHNFKEVLRKRPQDVAASFFPVIGATIRRSIGESFRSMMESFSKTLELSFSLKGLRWRFEALRTGRPFSEIVLLHTLLYRVEQAFFIHAETGLVLSHAVNEGVESQDADMVSAMLTAIQDFARDCFARGREGELESLRMGEFTILVERGPHAYLACVVRGNPPADFPGRMRAALELMLAECSEFLEDFDGDNGPFQVALRYLQDLLVEKKQDGDKPLPLYVKLLPVLVLVLVLAFVGWRVYEHRQETALVAAHHQRLERGVDVLRDEPGYVVLEVERAQNLDGWRIFLLKDALARPWGEILADAGLSGDDLQVRESPYLSYQPELIERRLREKIQPLPTVSVSLDGDGVLHMVGTAPMGWILQTRQTALSQPGVTSVDISGLRDPGHDQMAGLVASLEGASVLFPLGKAVPEGEELAKLAGIVERLAALDRLAKEMGMTVGLTIYGHADATGNEKRNYEISLERSKTLAAMLYSHGSSIPIALYGLGAEYADTGRVTGQGDQASRKIELRVHLNQAPEADFETLQRLYQ